MRWLARPHQHHQLKGTRKGGPLWVWRGCVLLCLCLVGARVLPGESVPKKGESRTGHPGRWLARAPEVEPERGEEALRCSHSSLLNALIECSSGQTAGLEATESPLGWGSLGLETGLRPRPGLQLWRQAAVLPLWKATKPSLRLRLQWDESPQPPLPSTKPCPLWLPSQPN